MLATKLVCGPVTDLASRPYLDDYAYKAAANVKEATGLIETGYEYICEMERVKLFRKHK
jgi:hypothetical protein